MIELGEVQELLLKRIKSSGAFLGIEGVEDPEEDVLLPGKELEESDKPGDKIKVFIYKDHSSRLIATKTIPYVTLGTIAHLEVKEITKIGAFVNWGLEKDLFLPFKEQTVKLDRGRKYLMALYIDRSERLCATMKIRDYLRQDSPYKENDWITGTIYNIVNDIGAFIAVDDQYEALLPKEECKGVLSIGESVSARVSSVKEDGRLNLSIKERGFMEIDTDATMIYEILTENDGFMPVNDKSDPDEIRNLFSISKASFKRAVGRLLKNGKIEFYKNGLRIKGE